MFFAILTLLSALTVAGVSGWFSIVGVMSIYAGAPLHAALVMGVVLEGAKLVTTSWLYRNWAFASWKLKIPLIYFTAALMIATSIGVFGFLTKAHLEQGAATVDNTAKVERLDQQIAREKATIADNEKVIAQLDTAINSFLGNDKTDRALAVRRAQAPQRKQLREEIQVAQKQIDVYSEEKLKLTSEVRALQLEVGPIRYIAELFYGSGGDETAKVETAVRIFTLLIVSTLDPLAVILLIAANHTLLRRQNEKDKKSEEKIEDEKTTPADREVLPILPPESDESKDKETIRTQPDPEKVSDNSITIAAEDTDKENIQEDGKDIQMDETIHVKEVEASPPTVEFDDPGVREFFARGKEIARRLDNNESLEGIPGVIRVEVTDEPVYISEIVEINNDDNVGIEVVEEPTISPVVSLPTAPLPVIISPSVSRITQPEVEVKEEIQISTEEIKPQSTQTQPWAHNEEVLAEILGNQPHFVPIKINEKVENKVMEDHSSSESVEAKKETPQVEESGQGQIKETGGEVRSTNIQSSDYEVHKYPKTLSWLKEFKGN